MESDDACCEHHGQDAKDSQQHGGLYILHHIGGDEARTDEEDHGEDVESLRQYLSSLLVHPFGHEDACAILDNKRPAHDLGTHVEELGDDTLAVILQCEDAPQGGHGMDIVVLIADMWHLIETDEQEHRHDD